MITPASVRELKYYSSAFNIEETMLPVPLFITTCDLVFKAGNVEMSQGTVLVACALILGVSQMIGPSL